MNRRAVITLLGSAAAVWPMAARAEQPMPVIGYLSPSTAATSAHQVTAFRQGLGETGYVEGRNVAIEYRWADGHNDRLPALAAELAARHVAVIAATRGDTTTRVAKAATTTIPIVFVSASDPVTGGLVASLNRPGGNLTGVTRFSAELMPKRLDILCEVVPDATVIDLLVNPTGAITASSTKELEAVARSLGRQIRVHTATDRGQIEAAFAQLRELHARALLIMADAYFGSQGDWLGALTARDAIPALFSTRNFAAGGGLLSYDVSESDAYRQVGNYVGRILKGERPADLPVMLPTKFELVINLKTAKALGLTIPLPLIGRADEVIE
jgi:putative ABC transport system substrate-binding protein